MRVPLPHEWTRFLQHAARVRSFRWNSEDADVEDSVFTTLSLYRPWGSSPFMPKLRTLIWVDEYDTSAYVQLFLHSKLTSLTVRQLATRLGMRNATILGYTEHICGSLEVLTLSGLAENVESHAAASSLITSKSRLKKYEGDPVLSQAAVVHLALLTSMTELHFATRLDASLIEALSDSTQYPFLNARVVDVTFTDSLDQVPKFLNLVCHASKHLTELGITCDDPVGYLLQCWVQLICEAPSRDTLRRASFTFPRTRKRGSPPPDSGKADNFFTLSALAPLLSLKSLTHLHVTSYYLRLDNPTLEKLANGLPNLKSLKLLPGYSAGRVPSVTLCGLIPLTRACPHLEVLGLAFNATSSTFHVSDALSQITHSNDRLHTLEVVDSPITDSHQVAVCLSGMFTREKVDIRFGPFVIGETADRDHSITRSGHFRVWTDVAVQMVYLSQARMHERRRMLERRSDETSTAHTAACLDS